MVMTVKLLVSGVAAVAAIGAAAVSLAPVAMASAGQAGVQVPFGTRGPGPYAQDTATIPLGCGFFSCSGGGNTDGTDTSVNGDAEEILRSEGVREGGSESRKWGGAEPDTPTVERADTPIEDEEFVALRRFAEHRRGRFWDEIDVSRYSEQGIPQFGDSAAAESSRTGQRSEESAEPKGEESNSSSNHSQNPFDSNESFASPEPDAKEEPKDKEFQLPLRLDVSGIYDDSRSPHSEYFSKDSDDESKDSDDESSLRSASR
jgi:hypothetical protein